MTVAQIIVARNPDVVVDARVNSLIELATGQTGGVVGTQRNDAIALLVLHWLALDSRAGAAGGIRSEKEGDLARGYHKSGVDGDLGTTSWG